MTWMASPARWTGITTGWWRWMREALEFVHPAADTDGDGMPDAAELIAGTDPTDGRSALSLSVERLSLQDGVLLRWPSAFGRTYTVEGSTTLSPPVSWQKLRGDLPGSGGGMEWRDAAAPALPRFYRVSVTQP